MIGHLRGPMNNINQVAVQRDFLLLHGWNREVECCPQGLGVDILVSAGWFWWQCSLSIDERGGHTDDHFSRELVWNVFWSVLSF